MNQSKAKEIFVKFYCKNRAFCELHPDRCKKEGCEIYHAIKAIEAEPKHEGVVEVVRCKDCKWIDLCKDPEVHEYKGENGFCSRGERREDEV